MPYHPDIALDKECAPVLRVHHRLDIVSDQDGVPVRSVHHQLDNISDQGCVIKVENVTPS